MGKNIWVLLIFNIWGLLTYSQDKIPLSIDNFKNWNTIKNPVISNDGKIVAYEQNPQRGDGNLIVRFENGDCDTIPRGANPAIGPENDFVVFHIKQPEDTIRKAKVAKAKDEDLPPDSLGVFLSGSRQVFKFPRLKSFKTADENNRWIVFTMVPEKLSNNSISKNNKGANGKPAEEDLILFNVKTSDTILISSVSEYFYSKKGAHIYYNRQFKDSISVNSSLYRFNTDSGEQELLFSDRGTIKKVVSDDNGEKYTFLFSKDTVDNKVFSLFFGTPGNPPDAIIDSYTPGMPIGWSPSEHSEIFFSENSSKLYFGTAREPDPEVKDTIPEEEKPRLDIWNWQDKKLQPQQLVEMDKEKKRTYTAVYHIDLKRFVQLADPDIRNFSMIRKGDADIGLGINEQPYLRESGWTGNFYSDYYVVDLKSGIKREIVTAKTNVTMSPRGKYVIWYEPEDSSYYSRDTYDSSAVPVALTKMIPVNFYDELNDRPMDPQPYGIAGWGEDDRFVYIYDRYDIWKTDPSGNRVPVCLTQAYGRRNNIRLRYINLDPDLEYIPSDRPVLLNAFNETTMQSGFCKADFKLVSDPQLLLMDNHHYSGVKKAKNASKVIFTKENVTDFPDLCYSDINFSGFSKISNANPQQCDYLWTSVQLEEWISLSGKKLKGLLYLPENIDSTKKYPLLVYYYERNSENLFRHQHPSPSRSVINKTFYSSNGYIVFVPDIVYKVGYPGHSAYEAVISGTQYLLNKYPFINKNKMGLQGQSWGGYQTAWLITRTSMFAAAMAGAPVSNMSSAYGGIRWQTGLSRMFQYEHQQSRIGGSLWEKPLHYIENSPLFYAPDINTPLLMMHNDNDGAVPWYQGIELFVALRRLDKPVWLLNYNGEPHNLKDTSWANRIDLSTRMFQFFNHFLKNQPLPEWMDKGVPAIKKGEELGY